MKVVLASASPRRAEILSGAGIPFEVIATDMEERRLAGEGVEAMVLRLAEAKARAASVRLADLREPAIVVGADTVVEMDGEALGKPRSAEAARRMLGQLSGREHEVLTGLAVMRLPQGTLRREVERTRVRFVPLTDVEIEEYVTTGEPLDKAGAYAIQGIAGRYVERIEGCYFNVVGLPLARLYRILREMGWKASAAGALQTAKSGGGEK